MTSSPTAYSANLLDRPHHDGSSLYVSDPHPRVGAVIEVTLMVPHGAVESSAITAVHVRYTPDAEATFVQARLARTDAVGQWWTTRLPVHNRVTSYRFLIEGGPWGYAWLNGTGLHLRDLPDAADFRIVADVEAPPDWAADAVVYQVFPDRFARSAERDAAAAAGEYDGHGYPVPDWALPARWDDPVNIGSGEQGNQLFGGDLDGARERLDHLQRLGADVLYLTPIFPGRSNHRYDASTFDTIDPVLGGDDALARLTAAAHERGLKVLGDVTLNHTGSGHEWFQRAMADPNGPERGFYFIGSEDSTSPWPLLADGALSGRNLPPYVGWLGVGSLPKLNYDAPLLWERLFDDPAGVIRRWLAPPYGLDGWRVDVANMTGRQGTQDHNHEVARRAREAMTAVNPDTLLVGEHTHDFSVDVPGDGWNGVMNYAGFIRPVWTWLHARDAAPKFLGAPLHVPHLPGALVAETIREFSAYVPWTVLTHSFTLLGSHDTSRIRTLVGEGDHGAAVARVGAAMLLTMPGIPMIPYGDEVGLRGTTGEDGRRPMPWDETAWEQPLFDTYQALIAVRKAHVALRRGGLRWVHTGPDALVFLREHADEIALVHLARDRHDPIRLPLAAFPGIAAGRSEYGPGVRLDGDAVELTASGPTAAITVWVRSRRDLG